MDPDESKMKQNPLKIEWSLFWDGILGDNNPEAPEAPLQTLTREKIKELIKDLSSQRRQLHKQIEGVNKEIELNSAKLESLKLVGGEPQDTISRINELSDKGQTLEQELQKLNQKLKFVRDREKDWA